MDKRSVNDVNHFGPFAYKRLWRAREALYTKHLKRFTRFTEVIGVSPLYGTSGEQKALSTRVDTAQVRLPQAIFSDREGILSARW